MRQIALNGPFRFIVGQPSQDRLSNRRMTGQSSENKSGSRLFQIQKSRHSIRAQRQRASEEALKTGP